MTGFMEDMFDTLLRGTLRAAAGVREERDADAGFLRDLFVACSPLRDMLPPAMLQQQAGALQSGHRDAHPHAMRRIVSIDGVPLGRVVIDWSHPAETRCVDIAVLPAAQANGIGTAILRAWLDVADRLGRPATLSVLRDNPAARLYARLGFVAAEDDDGMQPFAELIRAPRASTAAPDAAG